MSYECVKIGTRVIVQAKAGRKGKWLLARVVMRKRNGWYLLVTDCGREIHRPPSEMHDSGFDVLDQELCFLFADIRNSPRPDDPGESLSQNERYKMRAIDAFANFAQFVERGNLWVVLKDCRREFKRRSRWFLKGMA